MTAKVYPLMKIKIPVKSLQPCMLWINSDCELEPPWRNPKKSAVKSTFIVKCCIVIDFESSAAERNSRLFCCLYNMSPCSNIYSKSLHVHRLTALKVEKHILKRDIQEHCLPLVFPNFSWPRWNEAWIHFIWGPGFNSMFPEANSRIFSKLRQKKKRRKGMLFVAAATLMRLWKTYGNSQEVK